MSLTQPYSVSKWEHLFKEMLTHINELRTAVVSLDGEIPEGWVPFSQELKDKLDAIEAAATANSSDAALRDRATHTGTQAISTVVNLQTELNSKVDIDGTKVLSDENYTTLEKTKLSGIAALATLNATDAELRDRATHTGTQTISTVTGLQTSLDSKVDVDGTKVLSDVNFTVAEQTKLAGIATSATANATDAALRDRTTHTGVQDISTITNLATTLGSKVDVDGTKVLSDENYTSLEKTKLAGIADAATANATDVALRDRTTHTGVQTISTITGLQTELDAKADDAATTSALAGKVDVDGTKVLSDENYTTLEQTKLAGISAGATVNDTDANLRDRTTHTGAQAVSTITGLQAIIDDLTSRIEALESPA
jgi:hypothetical protein